MSILFDQSMALLRYLIRRFVLAVPLLIGVTLLTFIVSHTVPSDPVVSNLGQRAMSDPKIVAAFRAEWGLDKPLPEQYLTYLGNLVQGNLGRSIRTRRPVLEDIRQFLPATIELALAAILVGMGVGVTVGVISAVNRNKPIDHLVRFFSLTGVSVPVFWLALILLYIFYAELGWVSGPGRLDPGLQPPTRVTGMIILDSLLAGRLDLARNAISHLILPAVVLGAFSAGLISRVTRSAMLETLSNDYIRTARAKGLLQRAVVLKHALRNALIPVITVIGLSLANLLAGTVLTERIFAWPGIGSYAFQASTTLDFQAIMGVSLLIGVIFILTNLLVDLLYFALDPRMRSS